MSDTVQIRIDFIRPTEVMHKMQEVQKAQVTETLYEVGNITLILIWV